MSYDVKTTIEHGVVWAEDQNPYGHVSYSRYRHRVGSCLYGITEGYDEWPSKQECDYMIQDKSVITVVKKYKLDVGRHVRYTDSVGISRASTTNVYFVNPRPQIIATYRQGFIEPTRNDGTVSLYSLKQQAIVADVKGSTSYVDVKTGHPVDVLTLGR
ncbi:hypothetical protein F5Y07DRAFT_401623 [Xylaria sp. FL0933]|nr:hypothetical protein F5Y07DRAFT_401623 [Xylaria sp. FL0933]